MAFRSLIVAFVVSYVAVVQVAGQLCSPSAVEDITVLPDSTLVWTPGSNDDCAVNYYLIYIREDVNIVFSYVVSGTRLSLTFLPICESYLFTIVPVSNDGLEGAETHIYAKMPFPQGADLNIALFSVASRDAGVYLEWQVNDEWRICAERYRLTIVEEETDSPFDLYVNNNYITLTGLIPCAQYIFGVRAIYNLADEGSYTSTRYTVAPATLPPPTLRSVTLGTTTVDMSWQLETYSRNRCTISSLTIDATPYFRITYPVNDQVNRPPLTVHLTGLAPDTWYMLNVTAVNAGGTTAPALIGVQTMQ